MGMTVGDYVVRRLHDWGVPYVYGYPGDGINGLLGAFERHQDQVRFIQVRVGDGAMQMLDMNELLTVARHYREWSDPRFIVLVLNNQDLNQVTWEQRVLAGDPKFEVSQRVPEMNYAAYAELIGLRGIRVERPEAIGPSWEEALHANRPVVIDAVVDPEEAPLPPHITFEQARHFAEAMLREPSGIGIATDAIKEKVRELVPGR